MIWIEDAKYMDEFRVFVRFNDGRESMIDLKNYIESLFTEGMSWDNYGEWHIDHITQVISFDKETPSNIVNALSNLRPLWATTREINGVMYEGNLNRLKYNGKK